MSEEKVELASRVFEAFNRTFTEGTDDLFELLDPEVEWVPMSALLMRTHYHGHDGVREWMEEMKRDWTSFEVRPESYLELGDDRVLTMGTWRAQGRGGGVLIDFPQASWLTEWRKGRSSCCRPSPTERRPSKSPGWGSSDVGGAGRDPVGRANAGHAPAREQGPNPGQTNPCPLPDARCCIGVGLVAAAGEVSTTAGVDRACDPSRSCGRQSTRLEGSLLFLDPEIEFQPAPSLVGGFPPPDQAGVHRGHDGYFRMWQRLLEAWADLRLLPEEVIDFGEVVVVNGRVTAHARRTEMALDIPLFQVLFMRRGLALRQKDFGERDQDFEAAGMS